MRWNSYFLYFNDRLLSKVLHLKIEVASTTDLKFLGILSVKYRLPGYANRHL